MKKLKKVLYIFTIFALLAVPSASYAAENDIVDTAVENGNFNILASALTRAELVDDLKGEGPFTVFAPTDEAFLNLLSELKITSEQLLAQPDLSDVLLAHVVSGNIKSTDLVDGQEAVTLGGETLKVDLSDGVKVNGATVALADVEASNGVIHVIDKVIIPQGFELQQVNTLTESVPQTQDNTNTTWFVALLAASIAGLTYILVRKKMGPIKVNQ